MPISVIDRVSYSVNSQRVYTDDGFLKVPGRVARTGIQRYLASELGLKDRPANSLVNVYRPPDEVFSADSLESYNAADVTDGHPKVLVNSDTYRNVVKGVVSGVGRQDGDFVIVDVIVKDASAIKAVESGKIQLSAGYKAEYDHSPGVTPDGQNYEFIQRDIRINHVALVDNARAGAQAHLFDKKPGVNTMPKVVLDSGVSVEVADDATATLLQQTIDSLTKRATDAEATTAEVKKAAEKADAEKDEMSEKLKKAEEKTSDSAISERIKSISDTKLNASKLAGESFTCDSMDVMTIKREALQIAKPGISLDGKSDDYINARFDAAVEMVKDENSDQLRKIAADASSNVNDADVPKKSPRQKFMDAKKSAYKGGEQS